MKNGLGIWLLSACSVFLCAQDAGQGSKNRNIDVSEYVSVVNVEVIARVHRNGQPVGGLQKNDFVLFENGKKVEINGFREVRRRISQPATNEGKEAPIAQRMPERLFVFCFWLKDRHAQYEEALEHFFRKIFRPGDHVILAHGKDTFLIRSPEEIAPVRAEFEAELKQGIEQGNIARAQLYGQIDAAIVNYLNRSENMDEVAARMMLQGQLRDCWAEFQMKFLKLDAGSLILLAESLKSIKKEKWLLIFLQDEVFPEFDENGQIPAFSNKLEEMRKKARVEVDAFNDKVRSAFIAADATVSLIRLGSSSLEEQGRSPYYLQKTVYSNRDECFRKISSVTGGAMIADNNLTRALSQAADKEDICYAISFAPENTRKKIKIELTCLDKGLEVVSSRQIDPRYPRDLKITNASIIDSKLTFSLSGYARLLEAGRLQGRVLVRVVARGAGSLKVENSREFTLSDPGVLIPVEVRLPPGGKFAFTISVLDHISGLEVVKKMALRNNIPDTKPAMPHSGMPRK
jgi:VWFA-related protein